MDTEFLSTLSLRRATYSFIAITPSNFSFLSTLSLRRATPRGGGLYYLIPNFYPRSPCGERRWLELFLYYQDNNFYPRSPCGERPDTLTDDVSTGGISIHALLAESDDLSYDGRRYDFYFYPRSPCGERPNNRTERPEQHDFYPRSPCGERLPRGRFLIFYLVLFLSTLSLRRAT